MNLPAFNSFGKSCTICLFSKCQISVWEHVSHETLALKVSTFNPRMSRTKCFPTSRFGGCSICQGSLHQSEVSQSRNRQIGISAHQEFNPSRVRAHYRTSTSRTPRRASKPPYITSCTPHIENPMQLSESKVQINPTGHIVTLRVSLHLSGPGLVVARHNSDKTDGPSPRQHGTRPKCKQTGLRPGF